MALVGDIQVKLGLDVKDFQEGLSNAEKNMGDVGKKLQKTGKSLAKRVTLPLVGVGVAAVKVGMDFERSMSKVASVTGATGKDFDSLEGKARSLGASTKYSAGEVADGMSYLGMAGFDTNEILEATEGMLHLASISGLDLASTADIASNMLTGMGLEAKDTGRMVDVLAYTSKSANVDVGMLGESFKYAAPVASSLGIDLEDLAASVGVMGDAGIQGGMAGTSLATGLQRLAKPTPQASKLLKQLGIDVFDASGNMKSMPEVIGELEKGFDDLNPKERASAMAEIFGLNASKGWTALVENGSKDLGEFTTALQGAEGAGKEMSDIMNDNMYGGLKELSSALEEVGISVYKILQPHMETLVGILTDVAKWIGKLDKDVLKWGVAIGVVAAVIPMLIIALGVFLQVASFMSGTIRKVINIFGKLRKVFTAVRTVLGLISGPVGWVILGLTALVAAGVLVYKNWESIKQWAIKIWGHITKFFSKTWKSITDGLSKFLSSMSKWFSDTWDTVTTGISDFLNGVKDWFSDTWTAITDGISKFSKAFVEVLTMAWDFALSSVVNAFTAVKDFIVNTFNTVIDFIVEWGKKLYKATGLDSFVEMVVTVFTFVYDTIAITLEMIRDIFVAIWEKIVELVTPLIVGVLDFIVDTFTEVKDFTVEIFTTVKDFLIDVWTAISDFVMDVLRTIGGFFADRWTAISEKTVEIFTKVQQFFMKVWNAIYTFVAKLVSKLVVFVTGKYNAIKEATSKIFTAVKAVFTKIWNSIVAIIVPLVTAIWNAIKNAWDRVKSTTVTIFTAIKKAIVDKFNEIKDKVTTTAGNIWSSVKTKFTDVKNAMIDPILKARDKIKEAIDKVKSFFSGMKLKFPMPSMPSFGVKKGTATFLGKSITVPKFSVNWNAKGNIFNGASVLGGGQGVGEAGAEVVMPIQRKRYMKPYASMVAELMDDMDGNDSAGGGVHNKFEIAQLVVREEADIEKIAKKLEEIQTKQQRAKGKPAY